MNDRKTADRSRFRTPVLLNTKNKEPEKEKNVQLMYRYLLPFVAKTLGRKAKSVLD
jgi:hypothetical protein